MQKEPLICGHEGGARRSPSPWHSWQRQIKSTPRLMKIALLIFVICCAMAGFFRGMRDIHDQWTKQYPTRFTTLDEEDTFLQAPEQPLRQIYGASIDDRYSYIRALGKGQEGSTAVYIDVKTRDEVVVKTFESRARNNLPRGISQHFNSITQHWPTEIEAGQRFAFGPGNRSYVPVRDYFILRDEDSWSWALVTPLIKAGTLLHLAKQERAHGTKSIVELDLEYRPSFLGMLRGLQPLHSADLCHDDIKPDNIFVQTKAQWLLGDLGNVREVGHAWHKTASWTRQNQWRDCQTNDIRRALKSYLGFLRTSLGDTADFDREFWAGQQTWSRLYWDFVGNRTSIQHLLDNVSSGRADTTHAIGLRPALGDVYLSHSDLSRDTERELLCTTIPSRLRKRWWWLLGA